MENCCIIYFGGVKICDVTNLGGAIAILCSLAQKVVAIFCEQFDNQHCIAILWRKGTSCLTVKIDRHVCCNGDLRCMFDFSIYLRIIFCSRVYDFQRPIYNNKID